MVQFIARSFITTLSHSATRTIAGLMFIQSRIWLLGRSRWKPSQFDDDSAVWFILIVVEDMRQLGLVVGVITPTRHVARRKHSRPRTWSRWKHVIRSQIDHLFSRTTKEAFYYSTMFRLTLRDTFLFYFFRETLAGMKSNFPRKHVVEDIFGSRERN